MHENARLAYGGCVNGLDPQVYKLAVHHTFSIARAVEELGYHPKVSSLEGMRRVAKYYK